MEDEWQSYWDQVEDPQIEAEENFTNHLKVSQDKYLPKEDIIVDDIVVTEKVTNLTTFSALKKVPCPVSPLQQQDLTNSPPPSNVEPETEEKNIKGKTKHIRTIFKDIENNLDSLSLEGEI